MRNRLYCMPSVLVLLSIFCRMDWRRNRGRRRLAQQQVVNATTTIQLEGGQANEGEPHRGLVVGRRTVRRDRCAGYMRLMSDYFVHTPVYSEDIFRRRWASKWIHWVLNRISIERTRVSFSGLGCASLCSWKFVTSSLHAILTSRGRQLAGMEHIEFQLVIGMYLCQSICCLNPKRVYAGC